MDISEVKPLERYRLWLRFADGACGEIDLEWLIHFRGVFAPRRDRARFAEVSVHPDLGTICWPNGADLDPDVLHSQVTGRPLLVPPIAR